MPGMQQHRDALTELEVLRIKRALAALGLDIADATPETVIDLYRRLQEDEEAQDNRAPTG